MMRSTTELNKRLSTLCRNNSLGSPSAEWKPIDLSDPEIYSILKRSLKRLQRERVRGQRKYKERLRNLLNNVHSVRIQTSQDNSCTLIERVQDYEGSETESNSDSNQINEEFKEERGILHSSHNPRSSSSINGDGNIQNDNNSSLISQNQDVIIKRLEKILEERKLAGDSGEHSPYRVKLTALDNSCVMFALHSQAPKRPQAEEKCNQSFKHSPLTNSPLNIGRENESEEEKDSFRNRSLNSIKIGNFEEEKHKNFESPEDILKTKMLKQKVIDRQFQNNLRKKLLKVQERGDTDQPGIKVSGSLFRQNINQSRKIKRNCHTSYLRSKNDSLNDTGNEGMLKSKLEHLKAVQNQEECKYGLVDSKETQELLASKLADLEEYRSAKQSIENSDKKRAHNKQRSSNFSYSSGFLSSGDKSPSSSILTPVNAINFQNVLNLNNNNSAKSSGYDNCSTDGPEDPGDFQYPETNTKFSMHKLFQKLYALKEEHQMYESDNSEEGKSY
ncbi:unnamed protein product [Moneuplotes crassus]|uniref:Uncharacterized protein n=1 Tax=Euplotes crassus TaxID=5936 RepID=A0AAD1X525_EUPCR|nr:unnamed protein product [Moneuplotes crassus]